MTPCALKICGITRVEDMDACREAGVDAVGLNFWEGSRRHVSMEKARELIQACRAPGPGRAPRVVGVFVERTPAEVRAVVETLGLDAIQPHGDRPGAAYAGLGCPWIWVVRGTPSLPELQQQLTRQEGGKPPAWVILDALVRGYGGEGQQTDWDWAARAVRALAPVPVWLAGGIDPDNAVSARVHVRPAGLDVASGAEMAGAAHGAKDPGRVARLASICHNRNP